MSRPVVQIVTPSAARANNGNWRTAARWARLLGARYRVIVQSGWTPGAADARADCLLALHARRSHPAVQEWRERHPGKPLAVVLTGTDLYRDLPQSAEARASLAAADRLIVLQEHALRLLPRSARAKARVVYQSASTLRPAEKPRTRLNCILVAHLRPEKDPLSALRAWESLDPADPIRLLLVGDALDPDLARATREIQSREPRCRWIGPRAHAWTRQAIKRAHLLLLPSRMEGGANVIAEAVTAGTPVLASRISGNIGMLGTDYRGYFDVGDAPGIARLLERCRSSPQFYRELVRQCRSRSALFRPAREQASLIRVIEELL